MINRAELHVGTLLELKRQHEADTLNAMHDTNYLYVFTCLGCSDTITFENFRFAVDVCVSCRVLLN
jgi:hypothetical protein